MSESSAQLGRKHKPVHPGDVLRMDFLEPLGVSVYRLAKETGVSAQQYGRIIKGSRGVSADVALRLGRYLEPRPGFGWVYRSNMT